MSLNTHLSRVLSVGAIACGTLIYSSAIAGAPALEVLVYSGIDNSPPNFPGLFWNLGGGGFSNPVIDDSGNISFCGTLFGDGITPANSRVQYYGGPDGWTTVARNGEPALPGLPGLTLLAVNNQNPPLSPNGTLLVSSTLAGPGVTTADDTAFWYGPVATPSLMAREGTTVAPNTGGALLLAPMTLSGSTKTNNAGQVVLSSTLSGGTPAVTTTNDLGVYVVSSSGVVEAAREGNPIPGAPALPDPSGPFMTPDTSPLFLNGAGEVASTGTLIAGTAGGVTGNDDKVVWTTVGGTMRIVARESDPVPGMKLINYRPASVFNMATMGLTNGGKIIFNPILGNIEPGSSVTTANDTCWLVDDHGAISMVVREGDTIDGETFNFVQSSGGMLVNNDNRVAMAGAVVGASNTGRLWTGPLGGPYTRIVQQGVTTLPGDPTTILDFTGSSANAAFNSAGQIVFNSNLTGPGVTPGVNDRAILGWSKETGLILIARNGENLVPEILEVSQIVLIGATGFNGENGSLILTDNGWLVLRLQDAKGFQAIVRTQPFVEACIADVVATGSSAGVVDIDDLLAVISAWGPCADPNNCPADIEPAGGDDIVNIDDLLAVISAWGACP